MLDCGASRKELHLDLAYRTDSTLADRLHVVELHSVVSLLLRPPVARLRHGLTAATPLVLHAEGRFAWVDLHLVLLVLKELLLGLVDGVLVPVGVGVSETGSLDVLLKEDLEV